MTPFRQLLSIALLALSALPIGAQEAEAATLGLQVRGSIPLGGLEEVVGGSGKSMPGIGASLMAEIDLTEGFRMRVEMGGDTWPTGDWSGRPGVEGKAATLHISIEGMMMLNDNTPSGGPYVVAGLGGYAWAVASKDTIADTSTTTRILHVAGTAGFGYRLNRHLDVELRGLAGRISPSLFAAALQASATYRF
jgi:Outer membrane protein beta-barrel domain